MVYNFKKYTALILDWDGVFTDGRKAPDGSSLFSEIDLMGINLLRFGHFMETKKMLRVAIVTGERNPTAEYVAQREHFDAFIYHCKDKTKAVDILTNQWGITPDLWMFVFDDILDFGLASRVGFRAMVARTQSSRTVDFAKANSLIDIELPSEGSIRYFAELLLTDANKFHEVIKHRSLWSDLYSEFWKSRNKMIPLIVDNAI